MKFGQFMSYSKEIIAAKNSTKTAVCSFRDIIQISKNVAGATFEQYFLVDVPAKQPSILHKKTYKKISDLVICKDILVEIHCVVTVADIFNRFLVLFQKGEPLIHVLHSECMSLVLTIMRRFLK